VRQQAKKWMYGNLQQQFYHFYMVNCRNYQGKWLNMTLFCLFYLSNMHGKAAAMEGGMPWLIR